MAQQNKSESTNQKNIPGYTIPNGEFQALKKDVAWLKKNMSEVVSALLGNEYHEKGWLDRIRKTEEEIYKLKKLKWMIYGSAAVIGAVFSILTRVIVSIV